jgi:hypothetical protein
MRFWEEASFEFRPLTLMVWMAPASISSSTPSCRPRRNREWQTILCDIEADGGNLRHGGWLL